MNDHKPNTPSELVRQILQALPEELREDYEERAAIMEFDGELPREHAEALALLDVLRRHPDAMSQIRAFHIIRGDSSRYLLSTTQRMNPERLGALGYVVTEHTDIAAFLIEHFNGMTELVSAKRRIELLAPNID